MARKREAVVLLDELAGIEAIARKAAELVSRFVVSYDRCVQAGSEVEATEAFAESRALLGELGAHVDDVKKAAERVVACYVEAGELTGPEVKAIEDAKWQAVLNVVTPGATIMSALWGPVRAGGSMQSRRGRGR